MKKLLIGLILALSFTFAIPQIHATEIKGNFLDIVTKGPWIDVRAYATLALANTAAYSAGKTLLITQNCTLTASTTLTASIMRIPGGSFTKASTYTLAFSGKFVNPDNGQAFIGFDPGDVTFGAGAVKEVYPEWWGNNTTPGTTDMTVEIQNAIDSLTKGIISLQNTIYLISSTIDLNKNRVNLIGKGQQVTVIKFNPSANDIAIHVEKSPSGSTIVQCKLAGFALDGIGDTTHQKIGIQIVDGEEIIIDDIAVSNWTGATSIGIQFKGRQTHDVGHLTINADLPIDFQDNPNSTIDVDHFHGHDWYLISKSDNTQPVINIADGVNLSGVTFDGYQAWVNGSHGLYWNDTTSVLASLNLSINNVRWEQSTAGAGHYFIYISHNVHLNGLQMCNTLSGGGTDNDGIYLRKVLNVTLINVSYAGTEVCLNVDNTVYPIEGINCFWQAGSTATITGLRLLRSTPKNPNNGGLAPSFTYDDSANTLIKNISDAAIGGTLTAVAQDTEMNIGATATKGMIFITCSDNSSAIYVLIGTNHAVAEIADPSGLFSVTKDTASSTNIYWDGSSHYVLQNKRGIGSLNYEVFLIGTHS